MDTKNKKKSFISIFCILLVFILIFTLAKYNIFSAEAPTRFVNDKPWNDEKVFYWRLLVNAYYVPVTVFDLFDFIEISVDRNNREITMRSSENKLVIDRRTKQYAYNKDGEKFYMRTYELKSGTLWVPAEEICGYFGLRFEVVGVDDAMRISEYSNKNTIYDILRIYNPSLVLTSPSVTTAGNPVISETTSMNFVTEPPPVEIIDDKLIFLTFEGIPTVKIIDLLNKANIQATFFLTGEEILGNTNILRKIIVGGHAVGLHTMTHDENKFSADFNEFIEEIKQQNELLYKLIKQKIRIIRAPNGSASENFNISIEEKQILEDLGYRIWDWNVFIPEDSSAKMIVDNAKAGIDLYSKPVIRFYCDGANADALAEALPEIIKYIERYDEYKTAVITPAASEVNFVGKY